MKKILIYFYLVYKGDWDQIYNAIQRKERVDINELEKVVPTSDGYVTILDRDYPEDMKETYKPAFVLSDFDLNKLSERKEELKPIVTLFNFVNDVNEDGTLESDYFDGYGNITDFGKETYFRLKNILQKSKEIQLLNLNNINFYDLETVINKKFENEFKIKQNKKDIDLMA